MLNINVIKRNSIYTTVNMFVINNYNVVINVKNYVMKIVYHANKLVKKKDHVAIKMNVLNFVVNHVLLVRLLLIMN
jgi:hypothetical protein